jgi:hypothetical protein
MTGARRPAAPEAPALILHMIDNRLFCIMCGGDMRDGSVQVHATRINLRAGVAAALLSIAVAGCSGLGGPKKEEAPIDPNMFPANYRTQIKEFLTRSLESRADFRGALISPPVLKQVGDNPRYVVCVQFKGDNAVKTKVAIYFAGLISQFVDPTPDQCGAAAYQPFKELSGAAPAS